MTLITSGSALGEQASIIVIDDGMQILLEYISAVSLRGQPGLGHVFVKWVFDNQAVPSRCERVPLTQNGINEGEFCEFPNDMSLEGFDRSDRKFVAVALASRNQPEILNAVDSDWWNYRQQLAAHGVRIRFLCQNQFADCGE